MANGIEANWPITPEKYWAYLQKNKWVPSRPLGPCMIMSFQPCGLPEEVWSQSRPEKLLLGQWRQLGESLGFLSGFGVGAGSARMHMALALAGGVKELIVVGSVGSLTSELKLGDIVLAEAGELGQELHHKYSWPRKRLSSQLDIFSAPKHWPTSDGGPEIIDMEYEWLFSWCQTKNIPVGFVGVVSDSLVGNAWDPQFHQVRPFLERAHRDVFRWFEQRISL